MNIDISDERLKDVKEVVEKVAIAIFTIGLRFLWKKYTAKKGVKVTMTYGKLWGYGLITSSLTIGGLTVTILLLKFLGIL